MILLPGPSPADEMSCCFATAVDKKEIEFDPISSSFEGNSANQAIELLIQKGVPESHIIFLNLISVSFFRFVISETTATTQPFLRAFHHVLTSAFFLCRHLREYIVFANDSPP